MLEKSWLRGFSSYRNIFICNVNLHIQEVMYVSLQLHIKGNQEYILKSMQEIYVCFGGSRKAFEKGISCKFLEKRKHSLEDHKM